MQDTSPSDRLRDTLFGDMPWEQWPSKHSEHEPWVSFIAAREAHANGDQATAVQHLTSIVSKPTLESRHLLQAWYFLRTLGMLPPEALDYRILGVVVEYHLEEGLDLLAAYSDGSARYYNYSGSGVVWERPDDSLDGYIKSLLGTAQRILPHIGPWDTGRPEVPEVGRIRINILTPRGLYFGEGSMQDMVRDSLGGPIVQAAVALMMAMDGKGNA